MALSSEAVRRAGNAACRTPGTCSSRQVERSAAAPGVTRGRDGISAALTVTSLCVGEDRALQAVCQLVFRNSGYKVCTCTSLELVAFPVHRNACQPCFAIRSRCCSARTFLYGLPDGHRTNRFHSSVRSMFLKAGIGFGQDTHQVPHLKCYAPYMTLISGLKS